MHYKVFVRCIIPYISNIHFCYDPICIKHPTIPTLTLHYPLFQCHLIKHPVVLIHFQTFCCWEMFTKLQSGIFPPKICWMLLLFSLFLFLALIMRVLRKQQKITLIHPIVKHQKHVHFYHWYRKVTLSSISDWWQEKCHHSMYSGPILFSLHITTLYSFISLEKMKEAQ